MGDFKSNEEETGLAGFSC